MLLNGPHTSSQRRYALNKTMLLSCIQLLPVLVDSFLPKRHIVFAVRDSQNIACHTPAQAEDRTLQG